MFAIIGAASVVSGVTRLTITIAVIIYETTGRVDLVIHVMITAIISKLVADQFNISLYDMHVELKDIPFVETNPHKGSEKQPATELMDEKFKQGSKVVCFNEIETVHNIIDKLKNCTHNGFPVLNEKNKLQGLISRNYLIKLLKNKK